MAYFEAKRAKISRGAPPRTPSAVRFWNVTCPPDLISEPVSAPFFSSPKAQTYRREIVSILASAAKIGGGRVAQVAQRTEHSCRQPMATLTGGTPCAACAGAHRKHTCCIRLRQPAEPEAPANVVAPLLLPVKKRLSATAPAVDRSTAGEGSGQEQERVASGCAACAGGHRKHTCGKALAPLKVVLPVWLRLLRQGGQVAARLASVETLTTLKAMLLAGLRLRRLCCQNREQNRS